MPVIAVKSDDVLDGGEAEGDEGGVDDPVDDAVELAAPEVEHPRDGEALHELLDQRRGEHRGDRLAEDGRDGGVDDARHPARRHRAPDEHHRERPRGLRVVPVEEARDGHVHDHRGEGEGRRGEHVAVHREGIALQQRRQEEDEREEQAADEQAEGVEERAHGAT
jgi:hypothetical protein